MAGRSSAIAAVCCFEQTMSAMRCIAPKLTPLVLVAARDEMGDLSGVIDA